MPPLPLPRPIPIPRPVPRPFAEPPPKGTFDAIPPPRGDVNLAPYNPAPNHGMPNTIPRGNPNNTNYPDTPIPTWNLNPKIPVGRPTRTPTIDIPTPRPPRRPFPWNRILKDVVNSFFEEPADPYLEFMDRLREDEIRRRREEEIRNRENNIDTPDPNNIYNPNNYPTGEIPGGGKVDFDTPIDLEIKVKYKSSKTYLVNTPSDVWEARYVEGLPGETSYVARNVISVAKVVIKIADANSVDYSTHWEVTTTTEKHIIPYSGEGIFRFASTRPSRGYWAQQAPAIFGGYNPSISFSVINQPSPQGNPNPWKAPIPPIYPLNEDEEEDMRCRECEAARVIRALQQRIVVNETKVIPSPLNLGNLETIDTVATKTVFCLPGTQDAIKDQFNLLAELKKQLAKTFNQSRMAKVLAKIQQLMSVTDFILNLHNALMLSEDIVTTFFGTLGGAFDTIVKVVDDTPFIGGLFDTGEKPINSAEWLGNAFEERMKEALGVDNWNALKVKWAAFNNIVRGAAMQIQAARDIGEAQKDLSEMTASRLGKLHNKLAKAGVLFDGDLWEEKVNRRWAWMYKLEDMAEDNVITNTAQFVQSWGGQVLDIKEQKKEMEESRTKFQADLQKDLSTLYENKTKTNEASTGKAYTRSDANPPETDDLQS